jgi:hypothetical protein
VCILVTIGGDVTTVTKLTAFITTALALPIMVMSAPAAAYANAAQPNEFFGVANVTHDKSNGDYSEMLTANACGDVFEYAVIVNNIDGTTPLAWQVGVTLPTSVGGSILSTAELSVSSAPQTGMAMSESVLVNMVPNSRLAYIPEQTQMYTLDPATGPIELEVDDSFINGTFTSDDEIAPGQSGVLFFQAQVICEDAPVGNGVNTPTKTADIAKVTSTTTNKPTMLVKTGPAHVAAMLVAIAAFSAAAYNVVLRRQNAR